MPKLLYPTLSRGLVAAVVLSLAYLAGSHTVRPYQLPSLAAYQCTIIDSSGERGLFHVYIPSDWQVEEYAVRLCEEVLPKSGFSHVRITWLPREQFSTQDIVEKKYKVMWARHDSLKGLMYGFQSFYDVLLPLPTYKIHWISWLESPMATQGFFDGKRIGMLGDSQSQSAYQQPMRHLHENKVQITDEQVTFYSTKQALISDFLDRKLDLISVVAVGDFTAINKWPEQKKILITGKAAIGNWYIDNTITGPLRCQLLQSLSLYTAMIEEVASISIAVPPCT